MKKNNVETTVGIFLLLGLGVLCTLILFFGEVKDFWKQTYTITVQFPNASGLLKGSDVYQSGAVIGKVTSEPTPLQDTQLVEVKLKIDGNIKLRKDAKFLIGSSGLLGDRFVDVQPVHYPPDTPEKDKATRIENGDVIVGLKPPGLDDLMQGAEPLIQHANHIATQLDDMITRLNTDVLSDTSSNDLKETITKLREMVNNTDLAIKNANDLLVQAKSGKGTIGKLLTDKQTADNLAAFIANLKAHGPVFYRDDSADKDKNTKTSDKRDTPSTGRRN